MSILYGIDVSEHNGVIDWAQVKSSEKVDFAILRAGYGQTTVDKRFRVNAEMCNKLGIPIGVYWFSYATSADAAAREARACHETIQDYCIDYPVAFDFEDDSVRVAKNSGVIVTKSLATSMAHMFLMMIKDAGYRPALYSNPSYLNQYFDYGHLSLKDVDLWLAQWPANPKPEAGHSMNPNIWQYSSKGKIPGIFTDVDLNVSYTDYVSEKKEKVVENNTLNMETLVNALRFENQKKWFEKPDEKGKTLLEQAKELGFTDGSNPYDIPSRAEVMTMIVRACLSLKESINDECKKRMTIDDGK